MMSGRYCCKQMYANISNNSRILSIIKADVSMSIYSEYGYNSFCARTLHVHQSDIFKIVNSSALQLGNVLSVPVNIVGNN